MYAARIALLQARLNSLVNPRLRDIEAIRAEIAFCEEQEDEEHFPYDDRESYARCAD